MRDEKFDIDLFAQASTRQQRASHQAFYKQSNEPGRPGALWAEQDVSDGPTSTVTSPSLTLRIR